MRIEPRIGLNANSERTIRGLVLICEGESESEIVDAVFGDQPDENGLIGVRKAEARLSDGYGEHYIYIVKD